MIHECSHTPLMMTIFHDGIGLAVAVWSSGSILRLVEPHPLPEENQLHWDLCAHVCR